MLSGVFGVFSEVGQPPVSPALVGPGLDVTLWEARLSFDPWSSCGIQVPP